MASLKDIKRRIQSVKSTQKITNAMKLVSASKFAKASQAVQSSRPYGKALDQVVENLVAAAGEDFESPFIKASTSANRILVVVVGSDRGLCGAMNSGLFKLLESELSTGQFSGKDVTLVGWGKRPVQFSQRGLCPSLEGREKVLADTSYFNAKQLASDLVDRFEKGEFEEIHIAFPKFKSAIEQIPTTRKLLPFDRSAGESSSEQSEFIVEPALGEVLDRLVKRWIISTVHRILLEGAASEHGARMSAMDNATNNAKEVQKKLTLVYNRARQAAITTELTEIISGAEALN